MWAPTVARGGINLGFYLLGSVGGTSNEWWTRHCVGKRMRSTARSRPRPAADVGMTFPSALKLQYNRADKNHGPAKYEPLPTPPPALIVVSKAESK